MINQQLEGESRMKGAIVKCLSLFGILLIPFVLGRSEKVFAYENHGCYIWQQGTYLYSESPSSWYMIDIDERSDQAFVQIGDPARWFCKETAEFYALDSAKYMCEHNSGTDLHYQYTYWWHYEDP